MFLTNREESLKTISKYSILNVINDKKEIKLNELIKIILEVIKPSTTLDEFEIKKKIRSVLEYLIKLELIKFDGKTVKKNWCEENV